MNLQRWRAGLLISNREGKGEGEEKEEVVRVGWAEEEIKGKKRKKEQGSAGLVGVKRRKEKKKVLGRGRVGLKKRKK